ncbi:MAG TPA: DUF4388 domain-containing protein [Vicinamibacteria bacterium]|nr:DUF4388 domain-containing protein [Vicinamibacteria bacterium]
MAEAFPVSGNIEPASFPHLLVDLHRHGATGSLKVTGPVHPKALYFRAGRILFGSSNDPRDQLGAILIESGRITREQLDEVNAKVGPGNPLAKVLAESGFVNQRELGDAARVKVERILADVLSWSSGSFEFEDGVLPKGAVDLKLSTEKLLLAAVMRVPDRTFALRHVELSTVLEPVTEGESALSEVRSEVWPLLERLDGRRTLKDAIALTRLDEFEAAKIACAMLFLGIVRAGTSAGPELDLAQEAQSGFGGEAPEVAPHFTVPAEPAESKPPVSEPTTAFAFAPLSSTDGADSAATMILGFPPEPAAGVAPDSEPLGILPEEPAAPSAAEAPAFFVSTPLSPRPGTDTQPGDRPAYVRPETEPPPAPAFHAPAYEPPPPEPEPAPAYRPPSYEPPSPEPQPAPAYRAPAYEPPPPEPEPTVAFRPAYEPPAPSIPDISPPPAQTSRPSPEDLAALDALLNPSATGRLARPPAARPRNDRAEARPATAPPRKLAARPPARSGPSRVPLIAVAVGGIAVATVAAWYFVPKASPTPRPTAIAHASPAAPPATPPALSPPGGPAGTGGSPAVVASPSSTPLAVAAPLSTSPPVPAAPAAPVPAATPAPVPTGALTAAPRSPAPATPGPASKPNAPASAVDARALLRQGALPDAARAFAAALASGARNRFSLQVLVACAAENVQKAIAAVPRDELFIVPVSVKGKDCYRVCWGTYDTRIAAEAALRDLPSYFRQGGAAPRLAPLAELLP